MTDEQHVPIEDLAAYAAGDLDAAASVTVEAHVVLCEECRADVAAVRAATSALGSVPGVSMPADVAARLDAALAAERAPTREPAGTVLPMVRRRRPSFAALSAVAAGVALIAAVSIPLVTGGGGGGADRGDGSTLAANGPESAEARTRRLSSGLPYSRENLATTLNLALSGTVATDEALTTGAPRASTFAGSPAPGTHADNMASLTSAKVDALQTDPGRLAGCIQELVGTGPVAGRTPLVVDFGTFAGREAMVLVFPSVQSNGQVRPGRVDVYVVGGGCGVEAGGDILDFQRIMTPRL